MILIAIVAVAGMCAIAYLLWRQIRPRHLFLARDTQFGTIQPYKLQPSQLQGTFTVKRRDGKRVSFPMVRDFAQHRLDGKGVVIEGDLNTGQLIRPVKSGAFEGSHGIFNAAALADGRVDLLVRSTKASGITLQHILIGLAIVGGLVCIVIYQFAKGAGNA